jgi:hypothetical protein
MAQKRDPQQSLAAMGAALKDELATWTPKPKASGVFVVQYQDGGLRHRFVSGQALAEALLEWAADPDRSPYFQVRADAG